MLLIKHLWQAYQAWTSQRHKHPILTNHARIISIKTIRRDKDQKIDWTIKD